MTADIDDEDLAAIPHERRDFVSAYSRHMWIDPRSERPSLKLTTALMLCAGSTFIALAAGVVTHFLSPDSEADKADAAARTATTTWTGVAGWDCPASPDSGFTATGRNDLWTPVVTGGWSRNGCMGTYVALPVAPKAATASGADASSITWWFRPDAKFDSCELAAWQPRPAGSGETAGTVTSYEVLSGRSGTAMGVASVDQHSRAGSWVGLGRFPSGDSGVSVRLANTASGSRVTARLSAAQVRATCTSFG